jgi:hypothetical protein
MLPENRLRNIEPIKHAVTEPNQKNIPICDTKPMYLGFKEIALGSLVKSPYGIPLSS